MAKDKKSKKARKEAEDRGVAISVKLSKNKPAKDKSGKAKAKKSEGKSAHPLEALNKLADHPLLAELLAAGALAAVAAVAEAGSKDPDAMKSVDSAKKAGKAAAAAIGARLLKELGRSKDAGSESAPKKV